MTNGYRNLPHTADVRIEAWGASMEACVEQAVAGVVGSFADLSGAGCVGSATVELGAAPVEDLLVSVLDEVILRLDTESVLPLRSDVQRFSDGGLRVRFELASAAEAELIGAVPKGVSLHGLVFERTGSAGWRCEVTVDI